jgi:hypothetical protein
MSHNETQSQVPPCVSHAQPSVTDNPVIVLRYNRIFLFSAIAIVSILFIFCVIVLIATYNDFMHVLPSRFGAKFRIIVISFLFVALFPFLFNMFFYGDIYFYDTHVERTPFIPFFNKDLVLYKNMHIIKSRTVISLHNGKPPELLDNPIKYYKHTYINCILVAISKIMIKNPDCLPLVTEMIEKNRN